MKMGEKLRYLREVEGNLRGLGRALTQVELVRGIKKETGRALSQSYLSQIENGTRPHVTEKTRARLARFFNVHPGYLVDDPEGYHEHIVSSQLRSTENQLDVWLFQGAERFEHDPKVKDALIKIARQVDSREVLLLMKKLLDSPEQFERLKKRLNGKPARKAKERRS
jgi:transcriptional regulator with XRE-family HTH domain